MPIQILMPALSPTMEEGKLAKWLVAEGQKVRAGDIIAEIETDKATMEVEAVDEGTIGQLLIPAGTEKVKVNTAIAVLLADGESAGAAPKPMPAAAPAQKQQQTSASAPVATPAPQPRAPVPPAPAATAGGGAGTAAAMQSVSHGPAVSRLAASPLARRIAKQNGVDIAALKGSGPQGRIIERDVLAAEKSGTGRAPAAQLQPMAAGQGGTSAGAVALAQPPAGAPAIAAMPDDRILALYEAGSYEVAPHDSMRRIIAQRLTQSKQTIPHFYMSVDCRLDNLLEARERINAASPKDSPRAYRLSVNDFIIKALALALQRVPAANATWTEAGMLRHRHSDVGVAVAVEGGLFTPIIRHAELKTLGEISNEMKDLAERARKRRLAPHEYQGGTTSISNLGMYGIKSFNAVINPPHATILAVGAGEKRPLVVGNALQVATLMTATLSCDHRVVDGAIGAEMLNAFKALIEDPVRMLV